MSMLADRQARERAATAADCNLVVTAGAGTGKTTLLVDRLLHLLMRQPDPLGIGEIVALTFTNKAANDMKLRLRDRLATVLRLDPATPAAPAQRRDWERMQDLLNRYTLSKARLDDLVAQALSELEKSQIGTMHSFAAHLLRLYPLESGVDPAFHEDEGVQFKYHFNQEWALWLDDELGPGGLHREVWKAALKQVTLADIKELAASLTGELIPLEGVAPRTTPSDGALPPPIRDWVTGLAGQARALRQAHGKANTLERMLEAAGTCLQSALKDSTAVDRSAFETLNRDIPSRTQSWSKEEHGQAKDIIRVAHALGCAGPGPLIALLQLLVPFAGECRRRFVQRGYVSFDGLLARARDLLRDHPVIRRELKKQFTAILVDEFQDTDPVQYEMLLYLAEADGAEERDWRKIRLKPGKLFIVGDPKQSIYAFRRADMEAYDAVVEDYVLAQARGERHTLKSNFRSHSVLLAPINELFVRLFPPTAIKGLQPKSDPLLAVETGTPPLRTERLEMRLVRPAESEGDTDSASRAEAEELARWLREDVLDREEIIERDAPVTVKPRHVAVLLRTLTTARDYLEAFRRYEIPCLTEGEKHFFERQEVIDAVNVLRAAVNPHDVMALVGVLRSPLGALPDAAIEELARKGSLGSRGIVDADARSAASIAPVHALLEGLGQALPRVPLPDVLDEMLKRIPLLDLAAASMDQEQAVANLLKLRDMTAQLAQRPDLTLKGLVAELTSRVLEPPDEAESPLAEEGMEDHEQQGAVRLLSIHKSKGLEFPMVVLAGLHRGTARQESRILVQHDWSTGIVGTRVGDLQTVGGIFLGAKLAQRRKAEQARVLYVAMTRAKRRLVLSAGLPVGRGNEGFLSQLADAMGLDLSSIDTTTIRLGETDVPVRVVPGCDVPPRSAASESRWRTVAGDPDGWLLRWQERAARCRAARHSPLFTTPTAVREAEGEAPPAGVGLEAGGRRAGRRDRARLIGTLAHRVLEGWEFSSGTEALAERIGTVCRQGAAAAGTAERPELESELREIFETFAASQPYADLRRATILGRELPFTISWNEGKQVMEGMVDLLYRLDGKVWIADYKTDQAAADEMASRVQGYDIQARAYREAVARSLGINDVGFKFIFVRTGTAVEA